ncbi:MAG: zinc-dependent alcohol dehydrogenase [Actinomycetota bacterium]
MRALVYMGPRRMELQEAPEPAAGPGEVVFATRAAAVCGSDLHGFREASPRRIPPLIMGHEAVGAIDEIGEAVDPGRVGERVVLSPILPCGGCEACRDGRTNVCPNGRLVGRELTGGFASRFAVPASAAVPIAASVPDDLATLTEPLANAVHVTTRSVRSGDDVLVIGAGPIGVLMARMALEQGARTVYSTDPVANRLAFARAQGATPLEGDDPEAALREATDGRGVDVVIDAAGFEATWALGLRVVRPGGRVEAVGLGMPAGTVDFFAIAGKEIQVTGSFAWTDEDFARALALIEAGAIDTSGWFTSVPLAEGQRAFEELVDTTDRFKVVLTP